MQNSISRRLCRLLGAALIGTGLSVLATPITATAAQSGEQQQGIGGLFSSLGQRLGLGEESNPFLPPEKAFIFSAEIKDPHTLRARWDIADGYYLYRDKFSFRIKEGDTPPGVALGSFDLPHGKRKHDENFGDSEVFYKEMEVEIPLARSDLEATPITLLVSYQGCADKGFCYPPERQEMLLTLPKTDRPAPAAKATQGYISDQDRYADALGNGNILLTLATFFGLGLLLTFTPCVFPMIPILSGIIAGHGREITTRKAFMLSLTYVLAMAATYTVAGVLAGLFGSNLQAAFQAPWVLISFSLLFVALALSMFGFYELQIPNAWQSRLTELSNKQQGGTLFGAAIMGLLSALIVGPCVAAPLAGALIYIGQTGDALLGGLALLALALGMGAPLLVIGTSAGKLLPKAGGWMNTVKAVFGVMLLGVAIWLLERVLPGPVTLALWAILAIVSAVYLGALEKLQPEASGWRKLWKGTGVILLIYGTIMIIGASSGGSDVLRPLAKLKVATAATGSQTATVSHLPFKPVKGLQSLEQEINQASQQGRPVMLDFYADWCVSCKEMEKYTFSDPGVQALLKEAVLLQADVTANDEADQSLLHAFGLYGPPSILFFDVQGKELTQYRVVGFLNAEQFTTHLRATLAL